ncbi:MAG: SDR family NAD(P)-dependent oxidoreductase [Roseimicrobium sp.]
MDLLRSSEAQESRLPAVALVTGGAGGLGSAVQRELLTLGYSVHAPGRRDLDVTDTVAMERWFSGMQKLDLVVHCAGTLRDRVLGAMTQEDFSTVLETNLSGPFRLTQAALRLMVRSGQGHIVFIGSNSARWGTAGQANYAAAKAGLIALTQSLAREFGGQNIRVNCVLPGLLETPMTAHLAPAVREAIRQAHVLQRFNTCEAVAKFIAFMDLNLPHTSGQVFQLDSRMNRWT